MKNTYKSNKNVGNLHKLKQICKSYKREVTKAKYLHHDKFCSLLRGLRKTKPKEYWSIINKQLEPRTAHIAVPDKELFNHFKLLSSDDQGIIKPSLPTGYLFTWNPHGLNDPITEIEVKTAIKALQNNKSCGTDELINEFFKATDIKMLTTYTKFFNLVFFSGVIPEAWTLGIIKPLFKNKGDQSNPGNYRGITILSCLGKLFTSVLNNRLKLYVENRGILGEEQAGFRNGYSVHDNTFVLKNVVDLYLSRRKKLYCVFVDYSMAFDKINRTLLWEKLVSAGINGPILKVVFNMYADAKSCVNLNGKLSEFFECSTGVRQGENLSPYLFAIFTNDLKERLSTKLQGLTLLANICCETDENSFKLLSTMFLLLYADDTIILAESPKELQIALNELFLYCKEWKLTVNAEKTKVMIFSRGKCKHSNLTFSYGETKLSIVDDFVYLGIKFNYNGKFVKCNQYISEVGNKTLFTLLRKARKLNLPVDLVSQLFDVMVSPVLLYGCEIYAPYPHFEIERIHLKFCKYLLGVSSRTTNVMVYGELGRMPLEIKIKTRIVSFWSKIITGKQTKLSNQTYRLMLQLYERNIFTTDWIMMIKNTLNDCGLSNIWNEQQCMYINPEWLKYKVQRTLEDQYLQTWYHTINESSKCKLYNKIKHKFILEPYLTALPYKQRKMLAKFRTSNHRLPIEKGRHLGLEEIDRTCALCGSDSIGDECHYIFYCPFFNAARKMYSLVENNHASDDSRLLRLFTDENNSKKLSLFITEIMNHF